MIRKLIIDACGPKYSRRFFISDGNNFWNDVLGDWTTDFKKATLWADNGEASKRQRDLMLTQIPGELQTFVAPLLVEVKGEVDLEGLKAWLGEAVQVWVDAQWGTGPGEAMVMLTLDWDSLMRKDVENG